MKFIRTFSIAAPLAIALMAPAVRAADMPAEGSVAPDFTLSGGDLAPFTLNDALAGGKREALLIVVPSLDTPTCNIETNTFNRRLPEVPAGAAVFVVSLDLPFAQKRWAGANDAEAEKAELFEQIGRLKMELEWLKKKVGPVA